MSNDYLNLFGASNISNTSSTTTVTSVSAADNSNTSIMTNNSSSSMNYILSPSDLKEDDIELIKKELARKIQEQKEDLENAKSTRGWVTSALNGVKGWFGGGDKKVENSIANYETLLAGLDSDISNIDEVYKTIMGSDLDLASLQSLKGSEALASSIDSQTQEAIVAELENQLAALESNFETAQNSNGWISGTWDKFKNWTGIGASSNKTQAEIDDLKEQIALLKNGELDLATTFKNITGNDLNYENLNSLLSGEVGTGLDSLSSAGQKVDAYSEGQKMCTDVVGDMVSGIAAVGAVALGTVIGVCAAPFTAGTSLGMVATGFAIAGAVGAGVKTAIKASDCIGNEKEYTLKDAGYDIVTGSLNGAAAPLTNALGGAAGTAVMKACGQEALETTVKSTTLATLRGVTKEVVEESVEQTGKRALKTTLTKGLSFTANSMVDGGLSGFVDSSSRALAEGRFEDVVKDGAEGLLGGLVASPIIGAGFSGAGKLGSIVGDTNAGKAIGKAISSAGDKVISVADSVLPNGAKRFIKETGEKLNDKFYKTSLKNCLTVSDDGVYSVKTSGYNVQLVEKELSEEILEAITKGDNSLIYNYANETLARHLEIERVVNDFSLSKYHEKDMQDVWRTTNNEDIDARIAMLDFLNTEEMKNKYEDDYSFNTHIYDILKTTTKDNLGFIQNILALDENISLSQIANLTKVVNGENVELAQVAYQYFNAFNLNHILNGTNSENVKQKILIFEKLTNPDGPYKDCIPSQVFDIISNVNEKNFDIVSSVVYDGVDINEISDYFSIAKNLDVDKNLQVKIMLENEFSFKSACLLMGAVDEQNINLIVDMHKYMQDNQTTAIKFNDFDFKRMLCKLSEENVEARKTMFDFLVGENEVLAKKYSGTDVANIISSITDTNLEAKMEAYKYLTSSEVKKRIILDGTGVASLLSGISEVNFPLIKNMLEGGKVKYDTLTLVAQNTNKATSVEAISDAYEYLVEYFESSNSATLDMFKALPSVNSDNATLFKRIVGNRMLDSANSLYPVQQLLRGTNAQNVQPRNKVFDILAEKQKNGGGINSDFIAEVLPVVHSGNLELFDKLIAKNEPASYMLCSILNNVTPNTMETTLKATEFLSADTIYWYLNSGKLSKALESPKLLKNKDMAAKISFSNDLDDYVKEELLDRLLDIKDKNYLSKLTFREKMSQIDLLKRAQSSEFFSDEEKDFLKIVRDIEIIQESIKQVITPTQVSKEASIGMMKGFFANNNQALEEMLSTANFQQYGKDGLPLLYSRNAFVDDLNNILNSVDTDEQSEILDKLGITLTQDKLGYDGIINLSKLSSEGTEGEVLTIANRFIKENVIQTGNSELDEALNSLIQGIPEIINVIGKQQHETHDYSIDIHMLTVLKEAMSNPEYQNLSNQDKFCLKLATILHDIAKSEGVVDDGHADLCALYVRDILNKDSINLSFEIKERIYELVKNHHWLAKYNQKQITSAQVAALFRKTDDLKIAQIMAEADLKGVSADYSFYSRYSSALGDEMQSKIVESLNNINSSGQILLTNKIIDSSKIPTLEYNGRTYKVIDFTKLAKDTDMQQYGFEPGTTVDNLRLAVHMNNRVAGLENVYHLSDPSYQGFLCVSYISPENNATIYGSIYGVSLETQQFNVANAAYCNQCSGDGKDFSKFSKIITGEDTVSHYREMIASSIKETLGLNDAEYSKLFSQIQGIKYVSQFDNIPEIKVENKTFSGAQIKEAIQKANDLTITGVQNEANLYAPKTNAAVAKVNSFEEISQDLLDYAYQHDLPIYILGEKG